MEFFIGNCRNVNRLAAIIYFAGHTATFRSLFRTVNSFKKNSTIKMLSKLYRRPGWEGGGVLLV